MARCIRPALYVKALIGVFLIMTATPVAGQTVQIYDTEIENIIWTYLRPVLRVAGIDAEAVRIHLVRSDAPNAFVSRGQRLFVTTGLLRAAEHPGQVIGVLAHETGHIAGGHLARLDAMLRESATPAMLATILGAALGVLSGNSDAAVATIGAGNQVIQARLLAFSRSQEQSADRAAVHYLEQTRQSTKGLLEFMEILDEYQSLFVSRQDQERLTYRVTHPLTRDRMDFLRDQVGKSKYSDVALPAAYISAHKRTVAKLDGFIDPPARTLQKYPLTDKSIPGRYARAVAYYRVPDIGKALAEIDGLIAEMPDDPYFIELKGQILFEGGKVAEAMPYYQKAVEILPRAPLLRIGLAHAQIEVNREDLLKPAIANLEEAIRYDDSISLAWRLAATAYGRTGRLGESALASAEYALRTGRHADARQMAERAKHIFKEGSSGWLRAEDMLAALKRQKDR